MPRDDLAIQPVGLNRDERTFLQSAWRRSRRADGPDGAALADPADEPAADDGDRPQAPTLHERLRGLTLVQQHKLAAHGELSERIILERLYGKNVWEALLRNPRLSGPEVARIARMPALARPLLDHPVFPAMVVQMMAVGEDTGALDTMLHKISDFYDAEVESTTEALTSMIEPIMIAVVGGLIGAGAMKGGFSVIVASVRSRMLETETAFSSAMRTTLAGSTIPAS